MKFEFRILVEDIIYLIVEKEIISIIKNIE